MNNLIKIILILVVLLVVLKIIYSKSTYVEPKINADKKEKKDTSDFITSDLDDYY